jgi:hypothetical protein
MSNPTYPGDSGDGGRGHPLVRGALAVERAQWLDHLVKMVEPVANAVVGSTGRRDLLQGRWLSHSAHPFFVTVPLGVWTGVSALDVFGGSWTRDACRTLTGLGVLVAVPSALTGLAEWSDTNTRDRRTATVHALVNSVGVVLYAGSWLARRRGQHRRGALLAATGYSFVNVGGFFGGHLTEARKVGSHHPAIASS